MDHVFKFVDNREGQVPQLYEVREADPELEALLAEEEAIQRRSNSKSARRLLLEEAADLVDGDRNAQYGDPIDDFRRTAKYWSIHAGGVLRRKLASVTHFELDETTLSVVLPFVDNLLDPHDVAIMMTQLKNSRLAWSPQKQDHWADMAGYAACGWDCVTKVNWGKDGWARRR